MTEDALILYEYYRIDSNPRIQTEVYDGDTLLFSESEESTTQRQKKITSGIAIFAVGGGMLALWRKREFMI